MERFNRLLNFIGEYETEEELISYIVEECSLDELIYDYHDYDIAKPESHKTIGIELEVAYVDMIDLVEASLEDIVASRINEDVTYTTECNLIASYDSTVYGVGGVEFITHPKAPENTLRDIKILLNNVSCESHEEAGLHVHFSKSYWNYNEQLMNRFIIIMSMWRRFIQTISHRDYDKWEEWSKTNISTKSQANELLNCQ